MTRRDYAALIADIRRFRPLVVVVLAVVVLVPSFAAMATQGLSPLVVLLRLTEALVVIGALVWFVSAVVLHYAKVQVRSGPHEHDGE